MISSYAFTANKKDPLNKGTEILNYVEHTVLQRFNKKDPLNKGTESLPYYRG